MAAITQDLPPDLDAVVKREFARYFRHLAARVERAVRSLPADKLWVKPFPFGNSVGHLVLHLTGNLNHYIGAGLAKTGYVRDRPREFTDPAHYPGPELLRRFHEAVDLVVRTVETLDSAAWGDTVDHPDRHPIETQFGLVLVCAAHVNNHVGQMSYLVRALGHSTEEPPVW